MMGVVLWKNPNDGSAVIWCEDQGDLAFLNNPYQNLDEFSYFDVGDMVKFDVLMRENLRRAQNLHRVDDLSHAELVQNLTSDQTDPVERQVVGARTAEIIPFRRVLKESDSGQQAG